jgi:hypothetical protein
MTWNFVNILTWILERYNCEVLTTWNVVCDYRYNIDLNLTNFENLFIDLIFILWFFILFYKLFIVWVRKFFEH